jgi:4-carboxymuconolactone decarboxylase
MVSRILLHQPGECIVTSRRRRRRELTRNGSGRDEVPVTKETTTEQGGEMSEQAAETPVLDLLAKMTADSLDAADLDPAALMLVRIAALVAVDAPPASYLLNLGAAGEAGIESEQIQGVLAAVAPIVGTARVTAAAGNIAAALGIALDLAEIEE